MSVAATAIASPEAYKNAKLMTIPDVDIDKSGKFKYVLIKVHDPSGDRVFKHIVRGYARCDFHADVYDEVCPDIEGKGLDCECVGGGRIEHDPVKKKLQIYGYSQGFGQADHAITAAILSRKYKYENITFSNEGY